MYSSRRGWWIAKFVVFGLLMLVVFGLVTQTLWNWLVPTLFSGPIISFWQAMGLLALSKILFLGFSGGRGKWGGHRSHQWKQQWAERYSKLSPEEREKFKQKFKDKWCAWEENSAKQPEPQQNFSEPK
ncbi:MAG TPA: hypothetical protein VFE50_08275 [Cyclobacteriaceae bacterium]|nr:hypothetical protein [Cyclobacteriaceae bacterium]